MPDPKGDSPEAEETMNSHMMKNRMICSALAMKQNLLEAFMLKWQRRRYGGDYSEIRDPLISLVIATYSRGKILSERTIPCILNQTYQNFEIVIVGDHCIDDTKDRIAQIGDPRIVFYDLPKRGCYPADPKNRWFVQGVVPRNKGLELAKGKWLCWISDDDVLLPNHFESLLRFAQKGDYEFVSAAYEYEKNGKRYIQDASEFTPRIGGMQTWMYRSYLKLFTWNIHSWRKSWNRPCDYDLQERMFRAGVRMGFVDELVAFVPPVEGTDTVGLEAQMALGEKT